MADIISLPPDRIDEARARRSLRSVVPTSVGVFGDVAALKKLIDKLMAECSRLEAMRDPADLKTLQLLERARHFAAGHMTTLEALERSIKVAAPANENEKPHID